MYVSYNLVLGLVGPASIARLLAKCSDKHALGVEITIYPLQYAVERTGNLGVGFQSRF